jgi:penicillin-binding protein 2
VLAEHMGHGGSAAAPLAKEVIETYMKLTPQVPAVTSQLSRLNGPARSSEDS